MDNALHQYVPSKLCSLAVFGQFVKISMRYSDRKNYDVREQGLLSLQSSYI